MAVRHLMAMSPISAGCEKDEAIELSLEILYHVAINDDAVHDAAQAATVLYDYDVRSLIAALLSRYGLKVEEDQAQLWRLLIVARYVLKQAPASTDHEQLLYQEVEASAGQDTFRLADILNAGLGSTIAGCRVEAVRVLRALAAHLSLETVQRVLEVLLDSCDDESNEEHTSFILANVWEIVFLLPREVARSFLDGSPYNITRGIRSPSPRVRRTTLHGLLRLIALADSISEIDIELLAEVTELYASGVEADNACQKLMFHFFEDYLGRERNHTPLVRKTVLHINRTAYLSGVPLPVTQESSSFQTHSIGVGSVPEARLRRQNKLLLAALSSEARTKSVDEVRRLLHQEFLTNCSSSRIWEILGYPSGRVP